MRPDLQKPEPHKRVKARRKRREAAVVSDVRPQVVDRDGHCRLVAQQGSELYRVVGPCEGKSEWAHLGAHRRFLTMRMEPEDRHTTAGTFMACTRHHEAYDKGTGNKRIWIEELSSDGADGLLRYRRGDATYEEKPGWRSSRGN